MTSPRSGDYLSNSKNKAETLCKKDFAMRGFLHLVIFGDILKWNCIFHISPLLVHLLFTYILLLMSPNFDVTYGCSHLYAILTSIMVLTMKLITPSYAELCDHYHHKNIISSRKPFSSLNAVFNITIYKLS